MDNLRTLLSAITTPFYENGEINYDALKSNLEWYISTGIGGIVLCGGTGEFSNLEIDERIKLLEFAKKIINGKMKLVVGCAAESTKNVLKLAKHADETGVDGIMIIASSYFKPSPDELYNQFKIVSEAINTPIILYNNPGACGTDVTPEVVAKIMTLKNVVAIKEATGDLIRMRDVKLITGDSCNVMCGCDEIICETILNGATGWISITSSVIPKQCQEIFDLTMNGKFDQAKVIFDKYKPLFSLCENHSKGIQIAKYALDKMSKNGGVCRLPRLPLSEDEMKMVDEVLK